MSLRAFSLYQFIGNISYLLLGIFTGKGSSGDTIQRYWWAGLIVLLLVNAALEIVWGTRIREIIRASSEKKEKV